MLTVPTQRHSIICNCREQEDKKSSKRDRLDRRREYNLDTPGRDDLLG